MKKFIAIMLAVVMFGTFIAGCGSTATGTDTQPAAAPAAGQTAVTAPMPGNILDIKVNVGDTVNADDVVIILEAMKMENEIFAPASGKVIAINTTKGASVNSGDCLLVIG